MTDGDGGSLYVERAVTGTLAARVGYVNHLPKDTRGFREGGKTFVVSRYEGTGLTEGRAVADLWQRLMLMLDLNGVTYDTWNDFRVVIGAGAEVRYDNGKYVAVAHLVAINLMTMDECDSYGLAADADLVSRSWQEVRDENHASRR